MSKIRIAIVAAAAAISGLFAAVLFQSGAEPMPMRVAHSATGLMRMADNNTPDGTETQDPEQQEQQAENQQQCGNPNGC